MDEIEADLCFVALTRPAMKWGCPADGVVLNVILSFFIGLWGDNPFYWLICIVIHFPMRMMASIDHNFFRLGRLWLLTKLSLDSHVWGGAMLSPIPSSKPKKWQEMATSV